jgi:hypothetical protein
VSCSLRAKCLRTPARTQLRQVAIFIGRTPGKPEKALERMKRIVDSDYGKQTIARRFATVEPVFGNLRCNKRLDRLRCAARTRSTRNGSSFVWCTTLKSLTTAATPDEKGSKPTISPESIAKQ